MSIGRTVCRVGFDMVKPRPMFEAAYNDSMGVTAQFNRNILHVVNRELDVNLDPKCFDHVAFFSPRESRMGTHLGANRDARFRTEGIDLEVSFREGETIHTENSQKYTERSIGALASGAGL